MLRRLIRRGGKGKFPGGNGVIREIKFLKPATVSILSERRVYSPYGIKGGEPGAKGLNLYKKADGEIKVLGHREVLKLEKRRFDHHRDPRRWRIWKD